MDTNKVISFSHNSITDEKVINKLKAYGKKTGRTFSYLVIEAIKRYVQDIETDKIDD